MQHLLLGLEVDVRGAALDALQQDHVHEPHHRHLIGGGAQLVEVDALVQLLGGDLGLGIGQRAGQPLPGVVVGRLDGGTEHRRQADHREHAHAGTERHVVHGREVGRIDHRQGQGAGGPSDRQHLVLARDGAGHQAQDLCRDRLRELHGGDPVVQRLRVHHLLLGHEAEAHDDAGELVVGLLLLGEDHRELLRVDEPFAEDEVRETAADLPRALARAVAVPAIGRVPVAGLAVTGGVGGGSIGVAGGGISVAVAVRGRGNGRVGGWRFPGPFPVDAALEIHGRATRLQGRNQIDLTAGAPDVFDTYRTP